MISTNLVKTQEHNKRKCFLQKLCQPIVIQEGAADNFELDIIDTDKLSKSLFQGHNNNSKFKKGFKGEFSKKLRYNYSVEKCILERKKSTYVTFDSPFSKIYCHGKKD